MQHNAVTRPRPHRFKDRFGTISGFRLGRYKDEVKWSEVNAAWGQAVLLLDMMTRMYRDFKWDAGVLKPMASHSMVC
jgi:beclin